MYTVQRVAYKCDSRSISGFEWNRSRLISTFIVTFAAFIDRWGREGAGTFVKKANRREAGCYFHLIFLPEEIQQCFYCECVVISPSERPSKQA